MLNMCSMHLISAKEILRRWDAKTGEENISKISEEKDPKWLFQNKLALYAKKYMEDKSRKQQKLFLTT